MTGETSRAAAGGSLVALSEFEARWLTRKINEALAMAWDLVAEAYARRVWESLGYGSWDAYCRVEFPAARLRLPAEEREETVRSLRAAGLSTRAIASATGSSEPTVRRDLAAGASYDAPEPAPVTGLDGKHYRPRPAPPVTTADGSEQPIDAEIVDEPPRPVTHPARATSGGKRRRALSEQAKDAGWDLRKAVERIQRLLADDPYPRHASQMRTLLRGHLMFANDTTAALLAQMSEQLTEGDTP
jgi:hypothetical protein